ncbi:MAG: arginine--tRNA ligase [Roseiflexaceae bacterium]|nr:arginine--tRNA ligase [Roseiflexaceae bacterium]
MNYTLDTFRAEVRQAIAATGRVPEALIEVTAPKPNIPADLAFPAFRAAKELGLNPAQLAQELAAAITPAGDSLIGQVTVAGPFLNFALNPHKLAPAVLDEVHHLGKRYGHDDTGQGQTVLVEYSSPNVAKRMHVGHIRTTIIGQALFNIIQALGYKTISDNHLGDWGKQFGVTLLAIEHEGKPAGAGELAVAQLEEIYAKYSNLIKEDPALDEAARAWSLRLEQGDPQARELWQWCVGLTMSYISPLYARLGIHFDTVHGESFYEDKMQPVIDAALEQGIAYRDAKGAVVVEELEKLPTFLLQRSDSGTLYLTRDAATVAFREAEYQPTKIVYVVDARQELHFRQVFALAKRLGYAAGAELIHISFGVVNDQHGEPLSTRKGNMIFLQALLDEAHARARAVVDKTSPEFSEAERERIAEAVGMGAVIYNDLYQDSKRSITIDWDKMLALEGNSAPYIQYMHARCRSILRKAGEEEAGLGRSHTADQAEYAALLIHPAEQGVIKQLAKLPEAVREAGARYATFVIAEWCYETARALAAFYRDCPVLKAEAERRAGRLYLVAATAQALENGLGLLGIKAPERM